MVNVAGYGMMTNTMEQNTADMCRAHCRSGEPQQDIVVGIKTGHYEKATGLLLIAPLKQVSSRVCRKWWNFGIFM